MRYFSVETVSFTSADGVEYAVKELREYPTYTTPFSVPKSSDTTFDDLATQEQVFDRNMEGESYRLWEANRVEIADANFDLSRVRFVKVPVIE